MFAELKTLTFPNKLYKKVCALKVIFEGYKKTPQIPFKLSTSIFQRLFLPCKAEGQTNVKNA